MRLYGIAISSLCAVLLTTPAMAVPTIDFDVDGQAAPAVAGIDGVSCFCKADIALFPALHRETYLPAQSPAHNASRFDIDKGDPSGIAVLDVPFRGDPGYGISDGILNVGSSIWDAAGPVPADLAGGSSLVEGFADVVSRGMRKTIPADTMALTITVVDPSDPVMVAGGAVPDSTVSEPTILAALGLSFVALGLRRRRRNAA